VRSGSNSEVRARNWAIFLVSGFGSGAYSAKLFSVTKHRFSGFNQPRQCGEDVFRMLVIAWPSG